ncbi:MAG: S1 RNA-binding domain-containing protein [Dehalococcoidia bacterium]
MTDFGVFVDIGINHDGLVHVSPLANNQASCVTWHVL